MLGAASKYHGETVKLGKTLGEDPDLCLANEALTAARELRTLLPVRKLAVGLGIIRHPSCRVVPSPTVGQCPRACNFA